MQTFHVALIDMQFSMYSFNKILMLEHTNEKKMQALAC